MTTVSNSPEIKYFNRMTGQNEIEKVYGDKFIKFLYCSDIGKKVGGVFTNKYFSEIYGAYQDLPVSHKKVRPFIEKFNINMDEYESGSKEAYDPKDSYATFNEFFIRKFKMGKCPFVSEAKLDELVKFIEKDFIKDLNFCSHDNVSKKVNSEIVESIYVSMVWVISMVKEYFRLENKK
jgi:phosphatidylserine decarboxylase